MNVLIVDDDKLARKRSGCYYGLEKVWIRGSGRMYRMGRKALEFLRNHPVDIVFTGYRYAGN